MLLMEALWNALSQNGNVILKHKKVEKLILDCQKLALEGKLEEIKDVFFKLEAEMMEIKKIISNLRLRCNDLALTEEGNILDLSVPHAKRR